MTTRVKHGHLAISISILSSSLLAACSPSSDQCEQHPDSLFCAGMGDEVGDTTGDTTDDTTGDDSTDSGETGQVNDGCVPFPADDDESLGQKYACQGQGNGWLLLEVYGDNAGTLPPECVNWGPDGKPDEPTTADCLPIDLTMLPNDVPSPGACCTDIAMSDDIEAQCADDCGYAACKLAITKLRDAAEALPDPDSEGFKKLAEERVRGDLFGFADMLELPEFLDACALQVKEANGEVVEIDLGAGISAEDTLGHVNQAKLNLQCTLDAEEPIVAHEGYACESTPNIPLVDGESNSDGVAAAGAVTMFGPNGTMSADLSNIAFGFREAYLRDGSTHFTLTSFDADAEDSSYGSLSFAEPHIHLMAPISAPLVGDTVTFPAGSLRMEVSGIVISDGEILFGGERSSGSYVNTGAATAVRATDGGFAFVEAPFEAGGLEFVLNTEEGSVQPQ